MIEQKQKTKVRFTSLDIAAMVAELKSKLLGCRITNIYDLSPSTYLFKMSRGDDKHYLVCENGMRFHTTETKAEKNKMPSGFTMKYLRSKRLEAIRQVGMERVVVLTFGSDNFSNHLILELYSQGNIILTDQNYRIIQCMRSHQFTDKIKTAVGELYPFEYAANIYLEKIDVSEEKVKDVLKEMENPPQQEEQPQEEGKEVKEGKKGGKGKKAEKKQAAGIKLKDMIFKLIPCLFPQVIDHILTKGGFQSNEKCTQENIEIQAKAAAVALDWTKKFQSEVHKGYLLVSQQKPKEETKLKQKQPQAPSAEKEEPKQRYTDYAPYLHVGFENKLHRVHDSFSKAVDIYYENFKKPQEGDDLQQLAWKKYQQIKKDQQSRVDKLRTEQEQCQLRAQLIQKNIDDVDAVIKIFRTMLDNGYSWSQITKMLHQAKKSGDPLANMVHSISLQKGTVQILLGDPVAEEQLSDLVPVEVKVEYNAYTNATQYYESRKKNYQKEVRTKQASNQVLKVAEREALKDLQKRKNKRQGGVINTRKPFWFEKFYWFVTSQNYLVISGRDSHQNEMIVKKYMKGGDLYMHSDYGGAASTVIKNPSKEPVPRISLQEAAIFTVCRSKAWDTKIISGAWWVFNDQVSKSAPTGQFLPTGSFMIRGKKNFVYPNKMEMGITLLYHIGLQSVGRHISQKAETLPEIAKLDSQQSEIEVAHQEKLNTEEYSIVNLQAAKPKQQQQQKQQQKKGQTKQQQQQQQANKKQQPKPKKKDDESDDSDDDESQQQVQQTKGTAAANKSKKQPSKKQQQQLPQQPKHQNRNKKKLQKLKKYMEEQDEDERELVMKMLGAKEMKHMRNEEDEEEEKGKGKKDKKNKKEKFSMVKKEEEEMIDKEKVLFLQEDIKTENKYIKKEKGKDNPKKSQQQKIKVKTQTKTQQQPKRKQQEVAKQEPKTETKPVEDNKDPTTQTSQIIAEVSEVKQTKPKNATSQQKPKEGQQIPKAQNKEEQSESSSGSDGEEEKEGDKKEQDYDQDDKILDSDIKQLSRMVGKAFPQDTYDYLITMCAPYSTITENRFKIKLSPGSLKKGKAARNILHYFTTIDLNEHQKQIIKTYPEQQIINALLGNVKLGAAGMLKLELKEKAEKKEKRREKDKQKEKDKK